MNIVEIFKILEVGLSVVGFLAISAWLMRWAKGLHERTKELSEIDKEIRSALKDSFDAQKELDELKRKKLEAELADLAREMENKIDALAAENDLLRVAVMAVDVSSSLALKIREEIDERESKNIHEQYARLVEMMESNGLVSRGEFQRIWKEHPETLQGGATTSEEFAWRLSQLAASGTRVSAIMEAISVMTPKAMNYVLANPRATKDDVKNFISNDLRRSAQSIRKGIKHKRQ